LTAIKILVACLEIAILDDGQLRKSWSRYMSASPLLTAVMGL
jgi:hypothetical protein